MDGHVGPSVLLVEDDAESLELLSMLLGRYGWRVVAARDGESALQLISSGGLRPDAIVSDYMMPRLDGMTLINRIRQETSATGTPAILITAADLPEDAFSSADACLRKPVAAKRLHQVLTELVASRIDERLMRR